VAAPTPVGAVLEVQRLDGSIVRRTLYAGGDTAGQSERVLEAGLGEDTAVLSARLHWPSGYVQRLDQTAGFALDQRLEVVEPPWLTLSARVASPDDPAPVLTYRPVDAAGEPIGVAAAGQAVVASRSDGEPVTVTDHGDGRYTASLPHPGTSRITVISITVDGEPLRARPAINYQ
jgi:hypothetical protein